MLKPIQVLKFTMLQKNDKCRWDVVSVYFNYETINEQLNGVLRTIHNQNDTLDIFLPKGLTGITLYKDTYNAHILSLNSKMTFALYRV